MRETNIYSGFVFYANINLHRDPRSTDKGEKPISFAPNIMIRIWLKRETAIDSHPSVVPSDHNHWSYSPNEPEEEEIR